jgi:hypothetical protein
VINLNDDDVRNITFKVLLDLGIVTTSDVEKITYRSDVIKEETARRTALQVVDPINQIPETPG